MRKILVTGAGGFIGYNLCQHLAQSGIKTVGIDLQYPKNNVHTQNELIDLHVGDFRNMDLMTKLLQDTDFIVHLASAHLQISLDKNQYWDINVHSLKPLLRLCHQKKVHRFVHVSSVGTYGQLAELPADEDTPCQPQSIYGETKLAGEKEVLDYHHKTGFPVVILRPAWVFGPYCPRTIKLYRTLKKNRFVMIGDGNNLRHPVYIQDFNQSVELSMQCEEAPGEIFLIAGENAITTKELVDTYSAVMGFPKPRFKIPYWSGLVVAAMVERLFSFVSKEPPISRRTLEFFNTHNAFKIKKATNILSYRPRYLFKEGLVHCKDWLEKNGA